MDLAKAMQSAIVRGVGFGLASGYLLATFQPTGRPVFLQHHPYLVSITISLAVLFIDTLYVYPKYRSPLRHLPSIKGEKSPGRMIYESPRGKTALRWMSMLPDAQLIRMPGIAAPILVSGPDALRDILNTHSYEFEKPWGLRAFLSRSLGWGVIVAEGAEHRHQRKALQPAFHVRRVRALYGLMWEKTGVLLEELEKEITAKRGEDGFAVLEIGEWASRLTLDIIGPTAVGRDFQSLTSDENPIAEAFLELLRPSFRRLVFFAMHFMAPESWIRLLPIEENVTLSRIGNFMRTLCRDIIREKKESLQENNKGVADDSLISETDILSRIIQTGEFTDDQVADQMMTFLAAGHETTASALTWACYLCARHRDIQTKLREEIHANIASPNEPISYSVLENNMPYLHGVCEETLRLYPTVPATVRNCMSDNVTVAGYPIPRHTGFLLVPYAINRHPKFWGEDAHSIIPERWIDKDGETGALRPNKHGGAGGNFSELTFLHGPRACIGRDFAKAELRAALAGVVGRFEMRLVKEDEDEQPRVQGVVTMKPAGGMYLKFRAVEW